jgi:hypothetical protein
MSNNNVTHPQYVAAGCHFECPAGLFSVISDSGDAVKIDRKTGAVLDGGEIVNVHDLETFIDF